MRIGLFATALLVGAATAAPAPAADGEAAIGGPVERHGLSVAAAYLRAIETDPATATAPGEDVIHLECDVSAAADNAHGFEEGDFVPYLTCAYVVDKVGSDWRRIGVMLPMTAQDGPHYANDVPMDGPGEYRLTYRLSPPSRNGFFRHADEATGVPPWWEPFEVTFEFAYPQE
ncbi:MAG TPA: iron transporter [Paracoccaceae bacterium]|nr:iron transporter [Paracoccaceae bacterium]